MPTTDSGTPAAAVAVYAISVAAELSGLSIQALRLYERRGLLTPERTGGRTRRYSDADVARLRRIGELLLAGLNLAGIERVLALESDNDDLRAENATLAARLRRLRADTVRLASDNVALRASVAREAGAAS
ncbi:MerR family transcriptional regulator [Nakamurella flava]|uniref:MerR family transcriptional regulator n=1 Tax=Nakamurella flava TaxID=2576308 RepID=A0A4U6QAC0_9ACTN|nr:MerR family transcriptional regulator [Nakamurella flava]TKV56917.1 MerR family transcriptional regulator [Nakamurella flava]